MYSKIPKVSVLTPIYNTKPEYLRECIESILNQTFTDFEFLILNDSPNNTELDKIVKSYKDKRIKYIKNKKNIGITNSRNKLLDIACGEYIAVFDHDDISLPTRLEKEVKYLDEHPFVGAVSSNTRWFPGNDLHIHPEHNLDIKKTLMHTMVFAHTAMMVRKSVLDDNNIRYESDFSPAEDYMLVLRMLPHTMFHNIQDVLVEYRYDGSNTTTKQMEQMVNGDAMCRDYAARTFPYLCYSSQVGFQSYHQWIRLFDLFPVIKVKYKQHRIRWYLFGILPVLGIKR